MKSKLSIMLAAKRAEKQLDYCKSIDPIW